MAKFTGSSGSLYLNVYIEPSTQNIANNTTVVNWRMTVSRTGAYYTYNEDGSSTLSLDLNGSRVHSSNPRWHTSGEEFQMASGSTTVGHNADGTKSFPFSATFNPNNGLHGVITVSGSISLKTIPRSSSISFGTGTIGSPLAITINRASTSFTHTLRWAWGSRSGTIASGLTTSASWTIPMDFCNELPNNTSGSGTIFVDTYSGSTKIGTQSKQFSATVPNSIIPTLSSISVVEEHATAKGLNLGATTFIQIISNIKATINGATGTYGATIKSTLIEIEGKGISSSSNPASFTNLNFNGTVKLKATVTDSRGRKSAVKELSINLLEYFAPIVSINAYRTREYPNKIQVLRTWKIAPLTVNAVQKNKAVLKFRAAPLNSSTFVDDAGTADATWTAQSFLTNSEANLSKTYATNKSWVVEGVLSDIFTGSLPSIAKSTVSTETAIHAYDKDGRFGVGKIPELGPAGSLDVKANVYAGGKQIQHHRLTQNDGRMFDAYGKDINTIKESGFYSCDQNSINRPPGGTYGYLFVAHHISSFDYLFQTFLNRTDNKMFSRVCENGDWKPWKEYATTDHPNIANSGWLTLSTGVEYKKIGDVVYVNLYKLPIKKGINFTVGVLPIGYRPRKEIMKSSATWTTNSEDVHIQIGITGEILILGPSIAYDRDLSDQISFAI